MNSRFFIIPVFLIGLLFLGLVPDSLGHGLGSETMPPVMIGNTEATLEVNSFTNYVDIDGGEVVIFAGAPLSGFKKIVQNKIRVPIIDCAEAAVKQAELAIAMNKNIINKNKLPPKISIGIDKNLSELISHKTNNG